MTIAQISTDQIVVQGGMSLSRAIALLADEIRAQQIFTAELQQEVIYLREKIKQLEPESKVELLNDLILEKEE